MQLYAKSQFIVGCNNAVNYGFGRWTDVQRAEAAKQGFGYRAVLFARLVGWSFILLLSILDSIPVQKASSYCIEYSEDLSCPSRNNSLERSVTSSPDRIAPWFLFWIFYFYRALFVLDLYILQLMVWFWNPWCDVGYRWGCCWLLTYFFLELNNCHTIFKSFSTEMLNYSL